ncbi:MAG: hypothetical protein LIP77_04520, partial [Planctomycetes bacterium]|nr:hypothetical protein [Planctomycetota bacterium]
MPTKHRTIIRWFLLFTLLLTFRAAGEENDPGSGLRQEVTASGLTKTYNSLGRLVREENTVGGVVEYEHDDRGNAVVRRQKIADGVWAEWRREFSASNLLLAVWGPEGQEKRYLRGDDGFTRCVVERVDDERWSGVFYEYDENYNTVFQSIPVWVTDLDDYMAAKPTEGYRYVYTETGDLLHYTD